MPACLAYTEVFCQMNRTDAAARVLKLRQLINDYRYHYHSADESTMSEAAADSLKHELSVLESEFPDLIRRIRPRSAWPGAPAAGLLVSRILNAC